MPVRAQRRTVSTLTSQRRASSRAVTSGSASLATIRLFPAMRRVCTSCYVEARDWSIVASVANDDQSGPEWPRRLTTVIGQQIKHHRGGRMTARELADRCEQLGHRVETQVIANLETGRRANISLAERNVLAAALGVPPLLLECPLGRVEKLEPLPGVVTDPWSAARWFLGQQELPGLERFSGDDYGALRMFEQHAQEVHSILQSRREAARLRRVIKEHGDDSTGSGLTNAQTMERRTLDLETSLRQGREEMRRRELIPPELPPSLRYLDELTP
jgi:transcriptional regulator with XRE-family HTH domain